MDLTALPATYLTWLLGQSVAVVILAMWILSLQREKKRISTESSRERRALQQRNDELSDSLVDVLRSSSQERAERRAATLTNVIEAIEKKFGP